MVVEPEALRVGVLPRISIGWAIGLFLFIVLGDWLSVAPIGTGVLRAAQVGAGLLLLVAVAGAPVALGLIVFDRHRKWAGVWLCSVIGILSGFYPGIMVGHRIRLAHLTALSERSKPLVAAIRAFESARGTPPSELGQLVPEFLPEIPLTGIGAQPQYRYLVQRDDKGTCEWILFVPLGSDSVLDFSRVEHYSDSWQAPSGQRVGDWFYRPDSD